MKLPNPKKRLAAIIQIKKSIQQEMVKVNAQKARDLYEPLSVLLRHILSDENSQIYLEALSMLKFVVGSLSPYLSSLDLNLMMG